MFCQEDLHFAWLYTDPEARALKSALLEKGEKAREAEKFCTAMAGAAWHSGVFFWVIVRWV